MLIEGPKGGWSCIDPARVPPDRNKCLDREAPKAPLNVASWVIVDYWCSRTRAVRFEHSSNFSTTNGGTKNDCTACRVANRVDTRSIGYAPRSR